MKGSYIRPAVLGIIFLLASGILLAVGPGSIHGADAVPYGQVFERDYVSSVDGVSLPCSIYAPPASANQPMPVWVDLHSIGGPGGVRYDWQLLAQDRGWMIISPWGRNWRSMWMDGLEPAGKAKEPNLFDDFSKGTDGWSGVEGTWTWDQAGGSYQQTDTASTLKQALRSGSSGANYTVTVDLKENSASGDGASAMGVTFRRQANGDCYRLELANSSGTKLLRLYRCNGATLTPLAIDELGASFDLQSQHRLQVMVFGNNIEVRLDNNGHTLDSSYTYHVDPSEYPNRQDDTFAAGSVGLCSSGGSHQFKNFRLQNDFLFGETDLIDSLDQVLEEFSHDPNYRVDPTRIYLSGFSMGGSGPWTTGLHYPDRFSAIHPSTGATDIQAAYRWLDTQYHDQVFNPDGTPPRFYKEQDILSNESIEAVYGGGPTGSAEIDSHAHENSSRYILENALNTPTRIEQPKYDTIIPNSTDPVYIFWISLDGDKNVSKNAVADYAHSQYVWDKWQSIPGLTNCRQETALFGDHGEDPEDPNNIWDNTRYDQTYRGGGHGCCYYDVVWNYKHAMFFERSVANYGTIHNDPDDVAYKTYDDLHNRAWWLSLQIADPDNDHPGLARVHRDLSNNLIQVHAKNVKKTILDLNRMGMNTGTGARLRITADNATVESEPLVDTSRATDLALVGDWDSTAGYQVSVNGSTASYTLTPTSMTIAGVSTAPASEVVIDFPGAQNNLLANPGFENGGGNWVTAVSGGGTAAFELNNQKAYAHSGSCSARITDASATGQPFTASWTSDRAYVVPGRSYSASASVKTRVLRSNTRMFDGGRYSTDDRYNALARISLRWMDRDGALIVENDSPGLNNTNDWKPVDITAVAPANASYAVVVLKTVAPDAQGTKGSAWFDDVALRRGYLFSGTAPIIDSVTPVSGANSGPVNVQLGGSGFQSEATPVLRKDGKTDIAASNVQVLSSTTINCSFDLSGAATGDWDVELSNPNGERSCLGAAFKVRLPGTPLSVTSIAPNSGTVGTTVSITALSGAGFQPNAMVSLEKSGLPAINATGVSVVSGSRITCNFNLTGAQAGGRDVVVRNPDTQEARLMGGFTVNAASSACGSGSASAMLMLGVAMGLLAIADRHGRGQDPLRA